MSKIFLSLRRAKGLHGFSPGLDTSAALGSMRDKDGIPYACTANLAKPDATDCGDSSSQATDYGAKVKTADMKASNGMIPVIDTAVLWK